MSSSRTRTIDAGLADQVEVTRLSIRVLETESALAEITLRRDACVDHPLQGAVDGGRG
jgi:hypothetical protein